MAESITTRILARMTDNLKTKAPDAGIGITAANIERSRRRPAERNELPLITVRPLTEDVGKATANRICPAVLRSLDIAVTVRCEGEDADLDPYRNFAIETIMSDGTLGGIANEVEELHHDWDGEGAAADADYAEDTIIFKVTYQTSRITAVSK